MASEYLLSRLMGEDYPLDKTLAHLPLTLVSSLLDTQVTAADEIRAVLSRFDKDSLVDLAVRARLLLDAGLKLDREDIEEICTAEGVQHSLVESPYEMLNRLIDKLGQVTAGQRFADMVRSGDIASFGTFADFRAGGLDVGELDALSIATTLEAGLEKALANGSGKQRLVKVSPKIVGDKIYVAVYQERGVRDGRAISAGNKGKTLEPKLFEQSASGTYFIIHAGKKNSRVTFRSPEARATRLLKEVVGQVFWKSMAAISSKALNDYNLEAFKKRALSLKVHREHRDDVAEILASEIVISTAAGNILSLKTSRSKGDALEDFHDISTVAKPLRTGSLIRSVALKFVPTEKHDRRRITRATIYSACIKVHDANLKLVHDHLRMWGVVDDNGG